MEDGRLREIVVQAPPGENPEEVARRWAQRLELSDGVRIAIMIGADERRPRRFIALSGDVTSPQRYAAVAIGDALEALLRAEARPMDAWEILTAARRVGSPVATMPVATITRAARILARAGRVRHDRAADTWKAVGPGEEAA